MSMILSEVPLPPANLARDQENLTPLWEAAHAHLRPLAHHLPLGEGSSETCLLCGQPHALRISAHLRFGDQWRPDASVLYCESCHQFSLSAQEQQAHRDALGAKAAPLEAIDARLWARTPVVLNIEPTTRCNYSCWYCVGRHMEQEDIAAEDFEQVLDHFPGLQVVAIVGEGEPLLHKAFFSMVRMAKARGIRVVTLSNGSTFSNNAVREMCETGLDYVSISIDSIDPQTFASSRIGGNLDQVWRGIERLRTYRDENGYKNPIIGLKGTIFAHTRHEVSAIVAEAKRHGIDVVESFQPLNPKSSYVEIYPEDKLPLLANVGEIFADIGEGLAGCPLPGIMEMAQREQLPISSMGRPNPFRKNCDEEWIYSLLSGDVTPCCQIKTPVSPTWNLFRHDISEILSDPEYENIRFNLWNGLFVPQCEGCWKTL